MKTWFCYTCQTYHGRETYPSWTKCSPLVNGSQQSIHYDDSLCQLWATGLSYPLKVKR